MVRRAAESARPTIEGRGHDLHASFPDVPIVLEGDPTRLEQVIWNLLNNAAKYTDPGGRIDVRVGRDGGEAVVRVRDTGIGIESGMLGRIFDPFMQVRDRHGRLREGLGLGLNLVRSLVELHGGTITASSEGPGTGSEFVVRLPAPRASVGRAVPIAAQAPEAEGPPPRRRILIVDDNVDAAVVMARMLSRSYGQEVGVAHDGPGALEAARRLGPEVVLLDIGLPGLDGHEVARRLRAGPGGDRMLLVALTGWGQEEDRRRSQEAGFDRHLVKPVEPEDIVGLLRGHGHGVGDRFADDADPT
jgi:CheY-like chemotaxis protein